MHSSFALTELPYPNGIPTNLNTGGPDYFFNCPSVEHQDAVRRWFHQLIDTSSDSVLSAYSRLVASSTNSGSGSTLRSSLGGFTPHNRDYSNFLDNAQLIKSLQDQGWRSISERNIHPGLPTTQPNPGDVREQTNFENLPSPMQPRASQYTTPLDLHKVLENFSKADIPVNSFAQSTGSGHTSTAQNNFPPGDSSAVWLNVLLSIHKTLLSMTQTELTNTLQSTIGHFSRQSTEETPCFEVLRQLDFLRQSMESANNPSVCMGSATPSTHETASVTGSQLQALLCQLYRCNTFLQCDSGQTNTVNNQIEEEGLLQRGLALTVKSELPSVSQSRIDHLKLPTTDFLQSRTNYLLSRTLLKGNSASDDRRHTGEEYMETEEAEDLTVNELLPSNQESAGCIDGSRRCSSGSPKKAAIGREGGCRKVNRSNHVSHRSSFRLSQFLRHLLNRSDCNPQLICWVDRAQNTFKLVNSSAVARLWGLHKQKPNMNYETMGRAMRYYYAQNILRKVKGQRLVYQFLEDPVSPPIGCRKSDSPTNPSPTNSVN